MFQTTNQMIGLSVDLSVFDIQSFQVHISPLVWCFDQQTTAVNSLLPCHPVAGCLQHREPLSPSIVSVDIWMNDHWLKDEVYRKPTETPWVFAPKIPNARVSWQFSCYSGNEGPIDLCESMWNVVVKTEEFRSHNFGVDWYEHPLVGCTSSLIAPFKNLKLNPLKQTTIYGTPDLSFTLANSQNLASKRYDWEWVDTLDVRLRAEVSMHPSCSHPMRIISDVLLVGW